LFVRSRSDWLKPCPCPTRPDKGSKRSEGNTCHIKQRVATDFQLSSVEVERIIAEASKNSKFYLREVEKDRALGKKIEQLVKLVSNLSVFDVQNSIEVPI
jgi:hypothetical protein